MRTPLETLFNSCEDARLRQTPLLWVRFRAYPVPICLFELGSGAGHVTCFGEID